MKVNSLLLLMTCIFYCLLCVSKCNALNKYSAEVNNKQKKIKKIPPESSEIPVPTSIRELDKPFRMAKLNLVWVKAKHRLTDPKLQSLFSDLKMHDKEEMSYKHHNAEGKDKEGLKEARLRKKLIGIMSTYGLLDHFAETDDPELLKRHKPLNDDGKNYVAKDVFTDKRLNMLWAKAENAGFTHEELETLKEEFTHHQDKVNEYMNLLTDIDSGDTEAYKNSLDEDHPNLNEIDHKEEESDSKVVPGKKNDYLSKVNLLREKHHNIKNGYDHLEIQTAKGPNHKEFVEPKVEGLWRIAKSAQFSKDELESLKEELAHYETRLLKLRHLHAEAALDAAKDGKHYDPDNTTKQNIKKHSRTVQKLHADIESRILERHTEL